MICVISYQAVFDIENTAFSRLNRYMHVQAHRSNNSVRRDAPSGLKPTPNPPPCPRCNIAGLWACANSASMFDQSETATSYNWIKQLNRVGPIKQSAPIVHRWPRDFHPSMCFRLLVGCLDRFDVLLYMFMCILKFLEPIVKFFHFNRSNCLKALLDRIY